VGLPLRRMPVRWLPMRLATLLGLRLWRLWRLLLVLGSLRRLLGATALRRLRLNLRFETGFDGPGLT